MKSIRIFLTFLIVVLVGSTTHFSTVHAQDFPKIVYGETVTGEITNEPLEDSDMWTFEGKKGDVISISLETTSGDLEPLISFGYLDTSGSIAIPNMLKNGTTDGQTASIEEFELPDDQTYYILVSRVGLEEGKTTGEFELTLEGPEDDAGDDNDNNDNSAIGNDNSDSNDNNDNNDNADSNDNSDISNDNNDSNDNVDSNDNADNNDNSENSSDALFEETFDNNDADWETADEPDVVTSNIEYGEYKMSYTPSDPTQNIWLVAPGFTDFSNAPIFEGSYTATVEVTSVNSESGNYFVGMIFQVQEGYDGYLEFLINQDGRWTVSKGDLKEAETLADGELDEAVDFTDGTHTITVTVSDGEFSFSIDDTEIDQTVEDDSFSEGTVGLVVGTGGEAGDHVSATFDNLVVTAEE
jgi:hypothetical protein